jgi:hypothetical protein
MTHWVCKPNGTIQCEDVEGVSLSDMRKQLAQIIGDHNIISEAEKTTLVFSLCGAPTGRLNAYEITDEGHFLLFHGFPGPIGFSDCPSKNEFAQTAADPGDSFPAALQAFRMTSAKNQPTQVKDLIGRPIRVYSSGDQLTMDLRFDRTNIEIANGKIIDIWFG